MKTILGLTTLIILLPMWYTLVFQLLQGANVAPWVWSLFWVYMPLGFILGILSKFVED
jgi:hypothetical protein